MFKLLLVDASNPKPVTGNEGGNESSASKEIICCERNVDRFHLYREDSAQTTRSAIVIAVAVPEYFDVRILFDIDNCGGGKERHGVGGSGGGGRGGDRGKS